MEVKLPGANLRHFASTRSVPADTDSGILSAIGDTPVVRLARLDMGTPASIHAKLEFLNPGGSMKDRPALAMLQAAIAAGQLKPGGVVIESSSGNMGIGLAQACAYLGLQLICVVDVKTTTTNQRLLAAYGAQISMVTEPHRLTGEYLDARLERVEELMRLHAGSFRPDQYINKENPGAHCSSTAPEFLQQLGSPPDVIMMATSTCGTVAGFQKFLRESATDVRLVAIDAHGSRLFGGAAGPRNIPGLGCSKESGLLDPDSVEVMRVDDTDCVLGCQLLAQKEAILAGGSAGGVVVAALRTARTLPEGSRIAVVLADRGERYLDTVYSTEWTARHCPDLAARREEFP